MKGWSQFVLHSLNMEWNVSLGKSTLEISRLIFDPKQFYFHGVFAATKKASVSNLKANMN